MLQSTVDFILKARNLSVIRRAASKDMISKRRCQTTDETESGYLIQEKNDVQKHRAIVDDGNVMGREKRETGPKAEILETLGTGTGTKNMDGRSMTCQSLRCCASSRSRQAQQQQQQHGLFPRMTIQWCGPGGRAGGSFHSELRKDIVQQLSDVQVTRTRTAVMDGWWELVWKL